MRLESRHRADHP